MTMPDLWSVLHAPLVELLGWTLLHFVWQGVLVAAVLAGALYLLHNHSPRVRYVVGCAALLGLLALPVGTGMVLSERVLSAESPSSPSVSSVEVRTEVPAMSLVPSVAPSPSAASSWRSWIAEQVQPALPWIVAAWGVGVLAFAVRLGGGAWRVRRLRRSSRPAPAEWRDRLRGLADQMDVGASVALRQSERVESPVLAGWWRPVILVPVGFLSGIPPKQVEALLLHELAHVRRHDVLVGRLQAVVETLLFFHPATWWVSRKVREAREACCDDLAVQVGTDRAIYARALAALAKRALATPRPVGPLAANDGALFARIRRLLVSGEKPSTGVLRVSIAVAFILLLGGPALIGACASQQSDPSASSQQPGTQEQTEAEQEREISDFLLVVGATEDGFDLTCEGGCAWNELSFSTTWFGGAQFVDQYGMTTRSEERRRESPELANFLITFERAETEAGKKEVRLECKEGCAWKTLTFGGWDEWEQVRQPIDQNGMTRIAGIGEGEPKQLRDQSRRLRERAKQFEDWAEGAIPDTVRRRFRSSVNPDSLKIYLQRHVRPFLGRLRRQSESYTDSLRRQIHPRLDSLRKRMGERWKEEMPDQLRGQARRLREQAERLEERAESMERSPEQDENEQDENWSPE